jgi:lipopolysaccharide/colanic/teichoic acid biosynthesis glycosyltransferase
MKNFENLPRNIQIREANRTFRKRYNQMTPEEKEKLKRSSDKLGCIIITVVVFILFLISILTGINVFR